MPANLTAPPLAALAEYPSLGDTVAFQINGLIVVFLVLGSIWFLLELIGKVFQRRDAALAKARSIAPAPAAVVPASPTATSPAASSDGPPPEIVALIAAVVHTTFGPGHRIAAINPARIDQDWAREGRRQIFASHRVR